MYKFLSLTGLAVFLLLFQTIGHGEDSKIPPAAIVRPLLQKDLAGTTDKEALMLTVEYLPGGSSLPHRHDAQVFVYVLEGEVTMQVDGSAPVRLHRGETFYESPGDVHRVSANASKSANAKILVFMVKTKGAPVTRDVPGLP